MEIPNGFFLSLEGGEGSGKSTQINYIREHYGARYKLRTLREPGGTPIGEEIRHLLKHSDLNKGMTREAELLLMNASRAQLVREIIRPALDNGEFIACDRFYDSTTAYQGYGREIPLDRVAHVVDLAVGSTRPHLTLYFRVNEEERERRRLKRVEDTLKSGEAHKRDRIEDEADRAFFERIDYGFEQIAKSDPSRIKIVDAHLTPMDVFNQVRKYVDEAVKFRYLVGKT